MANLFGDTMPIIYAKGETMSYTLAAMDAGNKIIYFRKEPKTWTDFNNVIQERIKGHRLVCEFYWGYISPTNLDNLINIMNVPGQKFIKFPTLPRKYPFIVEEFEPGLNEGRYDSGDSLRMTLLGTHLVARLPSIDEAYTIVSPYYRILNTT